MAAVAQIPFPPNPPPSLDTAQRAGDLLRAGRLWHWVMFGATAGCWHRPLCLTSLSMEFRHAGQAALVPPAACLPFREQASQILHWDKLLCHTLCSTTECSLTFLLGVTFDPSVLRALLCAGSCGRGACPCPCSSVAASPHHVLLLA